MTRSTLSWSALIAVAFSLLPACGADAHDPPSNDVDADQVEIVRGIPDHGRNPAVVAVDIGEVGLCTGALIAPGVVLTARHCVARTSESIDCASDQKQIFGARSPSSLKIYVGDDISTARLEAIGKEVLTPKTDKLCGSDIALIVLDRAITDVAPLDVHATGVAQGAHVTAIGFGKAGDDGPAGTKLYRAHVKVLETSNDEFLVGESTCQGDSGGPALDEDSGEIVGVVSRGGPGCDGPNTHNIYTRADVFLSLIDEAIGRSSSSTGKGGGSSTKPTKPKPDFGAACQRGADCSAGVCVRDHGKQYCSRGCDAHDHCPTHFQCSPLSSSAASGQAVCTEH